MNRSTYDVVVVGAGPAGCAAAIAHAQRGASVLVVEADPLACRRFAGEWMHPTGVGVLDALRIGRLEKARALSGYGFVIFPDDGSEPIEMPYSNGVALSGEHSALVEAMREVMQDTSDIEFITHSRASRVEHGTLRIEDKRKGTARDVRAGRIVGADGRRSSMRKSLNLVEPGSAPLSYMASVELRDVDLPFEGFGHLVLGGPGPALFYRIGDGIIRGCLDVPIALGPESRTPAALWDGFAPVMPEAMRPALRAAIERGPSGWAINRFRPRTTFGRDDVALVGDAIGHVHPMTAMGMTLGLLDAHALAQTDDLEGYARDRRSYVPELLSNALYHCFRRDDTSATAIRRAMFQSLRSSESERRQTMDILSSADVRRRSFGSAFLRIAARAIGSTVTGEHPVSGLAGFGEWLQWPAALAVPSILDSSVRAKSTTTHPIPQLAEVVPTAAPVIAPEGTTKTMETADVTLAPAIERGCATLLRELERIATQIGEVPDATLAGPALSCMRAIVATRMSIGMAARMSLGRRRLATEGFSRLLAEDAECRHLAELHLVLLGGESWEELPITSLAEGTDALLECQTGAGGFVRTREVANANGAAGELELTALACRAVRIVRDLGGDTDALDEALDSSAGWVVGLQREDGSWGGDASRTAWALEAMLAAGVHAGDSATRRAVRWLSRELEPNGDPVATARSLRALVAAGAVSSDAIVKSAHALAAIEAEEWQLAREVVEALAACESRRAERPKPRVRRRRKASQASPITAALETDWAFCKESLVAVSRTFSRPITLLPDKLEVAVTLGYLLCRIADTVEDHIAVDPGARDELFVNFCAVLEKGSDPRDFAGAFMAIDGDDAELRLARELPRVMRVFEAQDDKTRASSVQWVTEMARGMSLYSHREAEEDGIIAVHTVPDLERYCYYVAGTVGHLLTDLFVDAMGEDPEGALAVAMRDEAEGFATGLQLTNILKDVTDDLSRGVTYVPRSECSRQGLAVASLTDPLLRDRAHAAVAPMFDVARERLDSALEYALLIPPEHTEIRLFCLLPLWMATRTLALARGNDAMFEADRPVKISRPEVEALISECIELAGDNDALRTRYARLYEPVRSRIAPSASATARP